MNSVLMDKSSVVIIDEGKHSFKEYRDEMLDIHLGYDMGELERMASRIFPKVTVTNLKDIICNCSGRKVEIFSLIATK